MSPLRPVGWGVALVLALSGCSQVGTPAGAPSVTPSGTSPRPSAVPSARPGARPGSRPSRAPVPGTAAAALARLRVRGRGPLTGYSRDQFGQPWLDADRNGCDTRNDILGRELVDRTYRAGTGGCVVLTGVLPDPYDGSRVAFVRGPGDRVDIDHVVALGNAWVSGAARWDLRERAALANDPLNLLAVDAHNNRAKGDGDAATWLPPATGYRCAYVARQIAVKTKYQLSVTSAEAAAMRRVLAGCPGQRLPVDRTRLPIRVTQNVAAPAAATPAPGGTGGSGPVSYANCTAVRAAGKAPLYRGQPGYSAKLDRDGDGIACE